MTIGTGYCVQSVRIRRARMRTRITPNTGTFHAVG